jgi:hypothetical protein
VRDWKGFNIAFGWFGQMTSVSETQNIERVDMEFQLEGKS